MYFEVQRKGTTHRHITIYGRISMLSRLIHTGVLRIRSIYSAPQTCYQVLYRSPSCCAPCWSMERIRVLHLSEGCEARKYKDATRGAKAGSWKLQAQTGAFWPRLASSGNKHKWEQYTYLFSSFIFRLITERFHTSMDKEEQLAHSNSWDLAV